MDLDHATVHIVAGCTETREGLVLESSRSVEGRRCGAGEGPQQVGVVAARKHVWAGVVCILFVCGLCIDLADSGCAVPL